VEPASAASVAGALKLAQTGKIPDGSTVVCILTGHGLKDPDNAILVGEKPVFIPCQAKEVIKRLGY
jgi:threonine synthase